MAKSSVKILLLDSYLAAVKNSVGSKIFRNLYAKINGKRTDILKNGELSCAAFASVIPLQFGLIKESHATVAGLERDLKVSGWKKIARPRPGVILIWENKIFGDEAHQHCGFYIGNNQAISNSATCGVPTKHHWTYGVKNGKINRKIVAIYWHRKLKN